MSLTAGGPAPPAPLLPRYGEASLADLMPSLLAALDVPGLPNRLGLEPIRHACLVLIDGLGWQLLGANSSVAPVLTQAQTAPPLSAGFPSTTAASLGSIGTGLPPGEHGLVGYTMVLPGYDQAFNCLRWSGYGVGGAADLREAVPPETLQPHPTMFERAAADGVEVTQIGPAAHARSGLTRAVLRGGTYHSAYSLGDQAAAALRHLGSGRRSLVYAYHADLDVTGHVRGSGTDMWRLQLACLDRFVGLIAERLPRDSLLVVTGDHGMIDLRAEQRIDLAEQPELAAGVWLLAGEARARHVHAQPGAAGDVLVAWRALLGDDAWVASREEAIAAGWFGPAVPDPVRGRIGDVVVAAHGPIGIVQRDVDPSQARLIGHHGSMTPSEQLVPFLQFRR